MMMLSTSFHHKICAFFETNKQTNEMQWMVLFVLVYFHFDPLLFEKK